ncbi:MAG: peptide deformylase [Bacteroidales bacterium]|jgi:peptide deformylase|nr:peptide deformylase [Bacteroidales bacterium]
MKYTVKSYGDTTLRKKAQNIDKNYIGLGELISDMWTTLYSSDGVGLAAPQIGMSVRIFVVDATSGADDEPELANFKKVFINPEIIELSGEEWIMNEGCLSLPEIREDIARPDVVKLKYCSEDFNEYIEEFKGYAGRIIQHEYDHLEGILLIDHLSPLRRRLLKSKLNNIANGKIQHSSKIKS